MDIDDDIKNIKVERAFGLHREARGLKVCGRCGESCIPIREELDSANNFIDRSDSLCGNCTRIRHLARRDIHE